jgi:predicted nucleotidyltransferase
MYFAIHHQHLHDLKQGSLYGCIRVFGSYSRAVETLDSAFWDSIIFVQTPFRLANYMCL